MNGADNSSNTGGVLSLGGQHGIVIEAVYAAYNRGISDAIDLCRKERKEHEKDRDAKTLINLIIAQLHELKIKNKEDIDIGRKM